MFAGLSILTWVFGGLGLWMFLLALMHENK
jgi:hypothetical protein